MFCVCIETCRDHYQIRGRCICIHMTICKIYEAFPALHMLDEAMLRASLWYIRALWQPANMLRRPGPIRPGSNGT